jgi:hypothetical protein
LPPGWQGISLAAHPDPCFVAIVYNGSTACCTPNFEKILNNKKLYFDERYVVQTRPPGR